MLLHVSLVHSCLYCILNKILQLMLAHKNLTKLLFIEKNK